MSTGQICFACLGLILFYAKDLKFHSFLVAWEPPSFGKAFMSSLLLLLGFLPEPTPLSPSPAPWPTSHIGESPLPPRVSVPKMPSVLARLCDIFQ